MLEDAHKNKDEIKDHTTSQHNETRALIENSASKSKASIQGLENRVDVLARGMNTLILLQSGKKQRSESSRRRMPAQEIDCVTTTTAGSTVSLSDVDDARSKADLIEENRMLANQVKALSTPAAKKKRINERSAAATKKHIQNQRHK